MNVFLLFQIDYHSILPISIGVEYKGEDSEKVRIGGSLENWINAGRNKINKQSASKLLKWI